MNSNEINSSPGPGYFFIVFLISCFGILVIISAKPDFIFMTENKVLSREFTKEFAGREFIYIHVDCTYYYPTVDYRRNDLFIMTDSEDSDFVRKKELCLKERYGFDGTRYKIIKNKGNGSGYRVLTTGEEMEREYSDSLVKTLLRAANFADDSIEVSRAKEEQERIKSKKVADSWENAR